MRAVGRPSASQSLDNLDGVADQWSEWLSAMLSARVICQSGGRHAIWRTSNASASTSDGSPDVGQPWERWYYETETLGTPDTTN
jgi:hypothetical protein